MSLYLELHSNFIRSIDNLLEFVVSMIFIILGCDTDYFIVEKNNVSIYSCARFDNINYYSRNIISII